MTKWQQWILSQDRDFQKEILKGKQPTTYFRDFGDIQGITIKELEALDDSFIFSIVRD